MTTSNTKPATITPTPGRMVWFWPSYEDRANPAFHIIDVHEPLAAVVAFVHGNDLVNLTVFDQAGWPHARQNVPLLQDSSACPATLGFCEWMPYQRGQAAKTEAAEAALASAKPEPIEPDLTAGFISLGTPTVVATAPQTQSSKNTSHADAATEELICARGANLAPRVTPADIEANIVSEFYFTPEDAVKHQEVPCYPAALSLLTFCVLVLRNGFTVTGESACASPENFNAAIGQRIARENAVAKVWSLMGYELRTKLAAQGL